MSTRPALLIILLLTVTLSHAGGIYKWIDEELHLALKYCGQGLEGQKFRDFRPPSSFDDDPTDGELRLVLKRKK